MHTHTLFLHTPFLLQSQLAISFDFVEAMVVVGVDNVVVDITVVVLVVVLFLAVVVVAVDVVELSIEFFADTFKFT
jgi:hypothetical protein